MKYLKIILSGLVIDLSLFTIFSLCKENDHSKAMLERLSSLDSEGVLRIEKSLNRTIVDIRDTLDKGDEATREQLAKNLSLVIAELYASVVSEKAVIKEFANKVLAPNQVPNNFLCAWILQVRVLIDIFINENVEFYNPALENIFTLADEVTMGSRRRITQYMIQNRWITKAEFIAIVKKFAPDLDGKFIQNIADHTASPYEHRGLLHKYYESLLRGFIAWTSFLEHENLPFRNEIVAELKILHKENWRIGGQILGLTQTRNHFIGNNVKYVFWLRYQEGIVRGYEEDFEDTLNRVYYNGWYYTRQDYDYYHLIVRVWQKLRGKSPRASIEYEPFLSNPSVGVPQSSLCRFSKRDFNYFFQRWFTTYAPKKNQS